MTFPMRVKSLRRPTGSRPSLRRSSRYLMSVEALEHRRLLAAAVSEFPLRSVGGASEYVTLGSNGNIWFSESSDNIGQVNSSGKVLGQYPIPTLNAGPGPIISGPDKNLWFIEDNSNQFGVVNPSTGVVTEVPILRDGASQVQDLTSGGPDGNIWFTEYKTNKIGEINPATHTVEEFAIPTANSEPYDITYDSADGDYWFAESGANQIGMINPTTRLITDYLVRASSSLTIEGIAADSQGNLWFTEAKANAIGMLSLGNPTSINTYSAGLSANAGLSEITKGPDNNLWFTESGTNKVGMINSSGGAIKEFASYGSRPLGIASGPNGALYAGIQGGAYVDSITTAGVATGIPLPTTSTGTPTGIVADSSGHLWFGGLGGEVGYMDPVTHDSTEIADPNGATPRSLTLDTIDQSIWYTASNNSLDRIDPTTHAITTYTLESYADPEGIVYDPADGFIWFTEDNGNRVGYINPATKAIPDTFITLSANTDPLGITVDGSGNVWWAESGKGKVGEYNITTQSYLDYPTARGNPQYIAPGSDGNLWYTAGNGVNIVETISEKTDVSTYYAVPGHNYDGVISGTNQITGGPDGELWMTTTGEFGNLNFIEAINPMTHAVTEYTAQRGATGITSGKDGNVWFTAGNPGEVGAIDLSPSATASQLAMTTQPSAATVGKGFGLVVSVVDAAGGVDTFYNGPVTIALGANPGGSTTVLGGSTTATAVAGVANFPGLTLNNPGSGYTITATGPNSTTATTAPFNVTLAATQLAVTQEPPMSFAAGTPFSLTVAAVDPSGNIDTSYDGTASIAVGMSQDGQSSTLGGTTLVGLNNGVATFTGLTMSNFGLGYVITATDPTSQLKSATTAPFTVTPFPATHLVFTTQPPSNEVAGGSFKLVVSAENNLGQVDTGYNGPISLSLLSTDNAMLSGMTSIDFTSGVATFSGLSIDLAGSNYRIEADSGSLTPAVSGSINVTPAATAGFLLTPSGGDETSGIAFPLTVVAVDGFKNVITNYSGTVHFSSTDSKATLPADYTFTATDQGSHLFQLTLVTIGDQTLTVADKANPMLAANDSIQVNAPSADLGVAIAGPPPTTTTGKLAFTVTVTNHGPNTAAASTLTDTFTLPAGASITTATPSQGTVSISGDVITATLGSIASQASATLSVVVTTTSNGTFIDTAGISSSTADPVSSNNSASLTATVQGVASLSIAPSTTSAVPNQPVTITATVATPAGFVKPSGMVTFYYGATVLGTVKVNAAGQAALNVSTLPLGTNVIAATYGSDPSYPPITTLAFTSVYVGDLIKDDFDGDGKADLAIYGLIPGTNLYGFQIKTSSSNFTKTVIWDNQNIGFGNASSIPIIGDYFGDGRDAYAIFTPDGHGYMLFQAISSINPAEALSIDFGFTTDVPVVADVDGDGKDDFGVYGPDANLGYRYDFLLSSKNFSTAQPLIFNNYGYGYGAAGATPVVADFDGSGHAGFGVYIPGKIGGTFTYTNVNIPKGTTGPIVNPPASYTFARNYGFATDIPIAVDYDGDGKADLAFYGIDPRTGRYRYDILTSSTDFNTSKHVYFDNAGLGYGYSASIPVMADYEGDGHADFAVYQPDGNGGGEYVFQDVGIGQGVVYDFATELELPVDAPTYVLTKKVRGS